jgi:hypothetical protein
VESAAFTSQKLKLTTLVYIPHHKTHRVSLLTEGKRTKGLASHQRGDNQANGGKGGR